MDGFPLMCNNKSRKIQSVPPIWNVCHGIQVLHRLLSLKSSQAAALNGFVLQVDRREIAYVQTPVEAVGWEAMDSVTFHVTSPPSSLESQTFKIDISYENTGPEHKTVLLANTGRSETVHSFKCHFHSTTFSHHVYSDRCCKQVSSQMLQ